MLRSRHARAHCSQCRRALHVCKCVSACCVYGPAHHQHPVGATGHAHWCKVTPSASANYALGMCLYAANSACAHECVSVCMRVCACECVCANEYTAGGVDFRVHARTHTNPYTRARSAHAGIDYAKQQRHGIVCVQSFG